MFKTVSCAVAALACVAMASPSSAQSFSPSWGTLNGSGTVSILQGTTAVTCQISAPFFSVTGPTLLVIPAKDLTPGNALCGIWVTTYGAWNMTTMAGPTGHIWITLGFSQLAPCYGTIVAQWDNVTRRASFSDVVLPAVSPMSPSCRITGVISVPGLTVIP